LSFEFNNAVADAIKLLSVRGRLTSDLKCRLVSKGYPEAVVEEVVSYLQVRKLLDDHNTVQQLINKRSAKRSVGIEKLRGELQRLGAPEELIEANLGAITQTESERALVALRGRYKQGTGRAAAGRFLFNRGFDEEATEAALDLFCGTE
jgi:regulatory protein